MTGLNVPLDDPTANVISIIATAVERQDDLRLAERQLTLASLAHLKEIAYLRAQHGAELRNAEAARINAIRAVDVNAVAAAAEVSATQTTTLAAQVALTADAMRAQVAASAQASQEGLSRVVTPLQVAIDDLRRAQYEAQGQKTQVVEARASNTQVIAIVALGASLFSGALVAIIIKLFGG